jgi:hypothetical protein
VNFSFIMLIINCISDETWPSYFRKELEKRGLTSEEVFPESLSYEGLSIRSKVSE